MYDAGQLCRVIFERAHVLASSIGPDSKFQSRIAALSVPARAHQSNRASWVSQCAVIHISHVNATYDWYTLIAEHFRPLDHHGEYPIGAMKNVCTLAAAEDSPMPSVAAEPKGKSQDYVDATVGHIISRQSNRLKNMTAPASDTTSSSIQGNSHLASTVTRHRAGGSSYKLATQDAIEPTAMQDAVSREETEGLAFRVRQTEALLTSTQFEATEQILAIMDRNVKTRLWTSEEGRLRCWLDIAQKFVGNLAIAQAYEAIEVDEDDVSDTSE